MIKKIHEYINNASSSRFYHWQQILSNHFPWSNKLMLFIFEKIFTKYPSLYNHGLSFLFTYMEYHEKPACLECSLNSQSDFSWDNHHSAFFTYISHSITWYIKRCVLKGLYLIINFIASWKPFLSETGFLKNTLQVYSSEEHGLVPLPWIVGFRTIAFSHHSFSNISQRATWRKRKTTFGAIPNRTLRTVGHHSDADLASKMLPLGIERAPGEVGILTEIFKTKMYTLWSMKPISFWGHKEGTSACYSESWDTHTPHHKRSEI